MEPTENKMSENEQKTCRNCGADLDGAAAGGICAGCLLKIALENGTETEVFNDSGVRSPAYSLEQLKAAFPQFEIISWLGQGGMGTVYHARQPLLKRDVVIKILPKHLAEKPGFAERFEREGQLLARLNHPNIVGVYDIGISDGLYFIVMEYVEGVNLREAMRSEKFTPEQALAIVPKICEALQYAHEEGVLHRDIKPENILLDLKGRVKIADFGIAKLHDSKDSGLRENLTGTGQIIGTPMYMAPEQIEQPSKVDHRADIYSLGVVFYELLTGELPIGRFAPPSEKIDIDGRIDEVVLKALEKERAHRQQSAGQLKTEIESLASSKKIVPFSPEKVPGKRLPMAGLILVVLPMLLFFPLTMLMFTYKSHTHVVESAVAADGYDSGHAQEDQPQGPSRVAVFAGLVLIAATFVSPIIGTVFGWVHIARISANRRKTLWFMGMVDALLWPFFIIWFVLWISFYGIFSAPFSGTEFRLLAETCGGLTGTFLSFVLMFLIFWKVLRWIFPKPASPARLAYNGIAFAAVGVVLICLGAIAVDGSGSFFGYLSDRKREVKESYETKLELYRTEIEKETARLETTENEHEKRSIEFHIESMNRNLAYEADRKEHELAQITKDNGVYDVGFRILVTVCFVSGGVVLVIGWICCLVHLMRIRKQENRPGLAPAAVVVLLPVIPLVWGIPVMLLCLPFTQNTWGPYGSTIFTVQRVLVPFMFIIGGLLGLGAVYVFLKWTYRQYFGKPLTQNTSGDQEPGA